MIGGLLPVNREESVPSKTPMTYRSRSIGLPLPAARSTGANHMTPTAVPQSGLFTQLQPLLAHRAVLIAHDPALCDRNRRRT